MGRLVSSLRWGPYRGIKPSAQQRKQLTSNCTEGRRRADADSTRSRLHLLHSHPPRTLPPRRLHVGWSRAYTQGRKLEITVHCARVSHSERGRSRTLFLASARLIRPACRRSAAAGQDARHQELHGGGEPGVGEVEELRALDATSARLGVARLHLRRAILGVHLSLDVGERSLPVLLVPPTSARVAGRRRRSQQRGHNKREVESRALTGSCQASFISSKLDGGG
eukprot:768438-Hanusia_phi.AAC.2